MVSPPTTTTLVVVPPTTTTDVVYEGEAAVEDDDVVVFEYIKEVDPLGSLEPVVRGIVGEASVVGAGTSADSEEPS